VLLEPLPVKRNGPSRVTAPRIAMPDARFKMRDPVGRELGDRERHHR
jgi:hypothetical protein